MEKFEFQSEKLKNSSEENKVQKLFGHCFYVEHLENNKNLPIGGDNIFSQDANLKIKCDFEKFSDFFKEVDELSSKFKLDSLSEWLKNLGLDIDPKLFATIFAFTKIYEKKYPENKERYKDRNDFYKNMGEKTLSDIFNKNSALCAEISALAKFYLQTKDIDSVYISGDVLWNKDSDFLEEHSFLEIKYGEKKYIYDPTNPVNTSEGKFPSIYSISRDLESELNNNQKKFITTKNMISKKEVYFGVNDGTNIDQEKDII